MVVTMVGRKGLGQHLSVQSVQRMNVPGPRMAMLSDRFPLVKQHIRFTIPDLKPLCGLLDPHASVLGAANGVTRQVQLDRQTFTSEFVDHYQ